MMVTNRQCLDCKCDISSLRKDAKRCFDCYCKAKNKRRYIRYRIKLLNRRNLGTGDLKEHRHKNFDKEHKAILKEKERLGLLKRY